MSSQAHPLETIQRWMQSVIMHPGGLAEGMASEEAAGHLPLAIDELEQVITRSRALESAERLEIYVTAYRMRLMECLRAEYSATRQAVGDELFDALLYGYLQQHPSTSYTLGRLGAKFADFLAVTPVHRHAAPAGDQASWVPFVIELARWERLVAEVFDGPGSEEAPGLCPEGVARLQSEDWASLRLVPAPDLRLATFSHGVHQYWRASRSGGVPIPPSSEMTRLAVHRVDYSVVEHEQTAEQYALLDTICSGKSLTASIETVALQLPRPTDSLNRKMHDWFADWSRLGFFCDAVQAF